MRSPDATSVHGFPGSGRLDSHTISRAAAHRYPSDGEEQWERIDHTNTLLAESAETWLRSGSDFIGVSTVRELKGKPIAGVVTAWLPKSDEGEEELYKVVHEAALKTLEQEAFSLRYRRYTHSALARALYAQDGDTEDLSTDQLKAAIALSEKRMQEVSSTI